MDVPPPEQPGQSPPEGGGQPYVPPLLGPQGYGGGPEGYANYPRQAPPGQGAVPPPPAGVRFAAISEAWDLIRPDFGQYILAMLIFIVVGYVASLALELPISMKYVLPSIRPGEIFPTSPNYYIGTFANSLISMTVQFPLGAGLFSMCIHRLRGEPANPLRVFDGMKSVIPLLAAGFMTGLLKVIGIALFIIPGFFVCGGLVFVAMLITDQKMGPLDAMAMSFQVMKKDLFMMGLLCFVAAFLAEAGMCACIVGALFTGPIYFMVLALHYHAYFPPQGGPETAPPLIAMPQYSV